MVARAYFPLVPDWGSAFVSFSHHFDSCNHFQGLRNQLVRPRIDNFLASNLTCMQIGIVSGKF
jgi:hypothetical protein